ncbi:MAG: hypothetical protein ABEK12_03555, partial [Candidatus Nanohaloarchaea archaeon]
MTGLTDIQEQAKRFAQNRGLFDTFAGDGLTGVQLINLVSIPIEQGVDPARVDWGAIGTETETFEEVKDQVLKQVQGSTDRKLDVAELEEQYVQENRALKDYMQTLKTRAEQGDAEAFEEFNAFAQDI